MTDGPAQADGGERALTLADVLQEEFRAISGEAETPLPPWEFDAGQILAPEDLRKRLIEGRDPVARALAGAELRSLVGELIDSGPPAGPADLDRLRDRFAASFNELLDRPDFYQSRDLTGAPEAASDTATRFAALRFRSQTRERIAAGPVRERNRLILEDAFPELQRREDARLERLFAQAHERKRAALCLSGGGIRSASFALGVMQGLARLGLLERFHYLSTVSGGGYIGGWLSAWMHRSGRARVAQEIGLRAGRPLAPEPEAISHIRTYSSYLSPKIGLLSADTWTLAAIYLRNLLLNWCVLIPLLAAALVVPQLLVALTRLPMRDDGLLQRFADFNFMVVFVLSFVAAVMSIRYLHANRPIRVPGAAGEIDDPKQDHRVFIRWCFVPMLVAVLGFTVSWAWVAAGKIPMLQAPEGPEVWQLHAALGGHAVSLHAAWVWAVAGAFSHVLGWVLAARRGSWREFLFIVGTGALGGLAAGVIAHGLAPTAPLRSPERLQEYAVYASLAGPALLATFLVFGHLYIGVTSRTQADPMFEWAARYSAWLQIAILAWLAAFGVVILAPLGLAWAFKEVAVAESAQWVATVVAAGAGVETLRQAYAAPYKAGAGQGDRRSVHVLLVRLLALPIFLLALLALLSYLVGWLMELPSQLNPFFADHSCVVVNRAGPDALYHEALYAVVCGTVPAALVALVMLVLVGYLLSLRIDTNRFSLHGMYRARLIRTFVGASRSEQERDPNRFTGFDERDDIALADLWRAGNPVPFHVVNAALNLVTPDELASKQRKANSFTFTPLHCGAPRLGYRRTRDYGGGITLGTAVTISGAAASPEMGYQARPLLSFLLTLFNVRLGWWLGNPAYAGRNNYRDAAPASSLMPLVDEALGRTDERNPYVYLSDGGHFENLGLYEMVLRRCHWIVVSDAGCDPNGSFEDLGGAIRRIKVDLGIPIVFAQLPIHARDSAGARAPDATYCAVGKILYSEMDGEVADGTLVYIKPAFYGREPPDVFNYAQTSPTFPHESTANQFFTEAQFESYRRLGTYIVETISKGATDASAPTGSAHGGRQTPLSVEAFSACVAARSPASSEMPAERTAARQVEQPG